MKITNIHRLYLSNFLTGLVFWYGIEKLFMQSIGINAIGIGAATAAVTIFLVLFDIPAGILADKWSRKGMLILSALALAICSFILGSSKGLTTYIIGDLFFGLYVVSTSGTYGAIMYDTLHEEEKTDHYSKINGIAYGLFLAGAGVGNVASGFLSHHYSYSTAYYLTIISCLLNIVVILGIKEPTFHKTLNKERILRQIGVTLLSISKVRLLRSLTIVLTLLSIAELFKLEFGQLYMLRYVTAPQAVGILWAIYAFAMSISSLIAHKLRSHLNLLVVFASIPYILMSFIDSSLSLVLFMVHPLGSVHQP
jgi:MFS family permease